MKPATSIGLYYGAGAAILLALAIGLAPWGLMLAWPALAVGVVATAYLGLGPAVFRKRDGRIHWLARLILGPYLAGQLLWRLKRRAGTPRDDVVVPGLRLGRLVSPAGAAELVRNGVTAVLDMTCEHSEAEPFRRMEYRNLQVLDLTRPSIEGLDEAVQFVLERMPSGEGYVHCAQGFGRSAIVAAACLLALDRERSVDEACDLVLAARPSVRLRARAVRPLLEAFRRRKHATG